MQMVMPTMMIPEVWVRDVLSSVCKTPKDPNRIQQRQRKHQAQEPRSFQQCQRTADRGGPRVWYLLFQDASTYPVRVGSISYDIKAPEKVSGCRVGVWAIFVGHFSGFKVWAWALGARGGSRA